MGRLGGRAGEWAWAWAGSGRGRGRSGRGKWWGERELPQHRGAVLGVARDRRADLVATQGQLGLWDLGSENRAVRLPSRSIRSPTTGDQRQKKKRDQRAWLPTAHRTTSALRLVRSGARFRRRMSRLADPGNR